MEAKDIRNIPISDKTFSKHDLDDAYKAGIREVVEFVEAHKETGLFYKHGNVYISPKEWEAQKKEWMTSDATGEGR